MKVLTAVLLTILAAVAMADKPYYDLEQAEPLFETFIKDHNRVYKDEEDKRVHFEAFKKSLHTINESNKNSPSATFGINKFADYTEEERKHLHGFKRN